MNQCEFCHKIFSNGYILKNHILNTKACLIIQGKEKKTDFICSLCKNHLSSKQALVYHENICEKKSKPSTCSYCSKLFSTNQALRNHDGRCKKKEAVRIEELTKEVEHYKKKCEEKTPTPTIINNIYNNVSISNYMTPEHVTKTFEQYYTIEKLLGGQKALADFVVDQLVGSDKMVYLCVDRSRKKCMVTNDFKTFTEDVNNEILLSHLTPAFRIMKNMVEWSDFEKKYQSMRIHGSFDSRISRLID
jgi:hypothetical protein